MGSFIKKLVAMWATIAAIVPALQQFVVQVETAFPAGTPGADKLAAVKDMLASMWGTAQGLEVKFEEAWPTLEALIGSLVAAFNKRGEFVKRSQ